MVESYLWWPVFLDREMTIAGELDPQAFLPFADTISGSRWPGENGGPRKAASGSRKAA
jgi:acetoacetate decarboxylase